jgi:hypothetical protein
MLAFAIVGSVCALLFLAMTMSSIEGAHDR